MSHRTFSEVALATTGVLALTALSVPAATAAGTGVTGALQPATVEAPSIGVPTTRLDVWPTATDLALGQNVIFDASYDSGNFDPGIIVWKSSDESVLTVDQEGHVSAVGVGEATITVTDKDDSSLTSTSTVQVREVPEDVGMELSVPEVSAIFNRQVYLHALLAPSLQGSAVTWSMDPTTLGAFYSRDDASSIDFQGAEQAGTGTLTATVTSEAGVTKTVTVPVTVQPDPRGDFITDDDGVLVQYQGKSQDVEIPEGVTGISSGAFPSQLTKVWVPASVRTIDYEAFKGTNLQEITFQDDSAHPSQLTAIYDEAFSNTPIETLTLPRSVQTVVGAFKGMAGLKTLHLGPNIGPGLLVGDFQYTPRLTTIDVDPDNANYTSDEGVLYTKDHSSLIAYPTAKNPGGSYAVLEGTTTIEQSAFENAQVATVTMPSTLRTIGSQAFTHSHLTSLTLPDGFESAGYWAFAYAEKLTSVDIGGATSLPDGAFIYARSLASVNLRPDLGRLTMLDGSALMGTALTSLTLPDSVTSIGQWSLASNTSLTQLHLGAGLSSIGSGALSGDTALATVTVNPANASFSEVDGVLYTKDGASLILYPASRAGNEYEVPAGTTAIGYQAFDRARSLTRVILPEGLTTIDYSAFEGCTNLVDMTFPESLEVVRGIQNTGLDTVILGSKVRELFMPTRENLAPRHLIVRGGVNGKYYTDGEPSNGRIESAFFGEGMTKVDVRSKGPKVIVLPSTITSFQLDPFSSPGYKTDAQVYVAAAEGSPAWEVAKAELVKEGIDLSHLHVYTPAQLTLKGLDATNDEAGGALAWKDASVSVTATVNGGVPEGRELRVTQVGADGTETLVQDWTAMNAGDGDASTLAFSWTPTEGAPSLRVQTRDITHVSAEQTTEAQLTPARVTGEWSRTLFGWRYVYPNGTYVKSQTIMIDGKIYRFGSDGFMRTGWIYDEGAWRYHDSSGAMQTGWVNVEGGWYYLMPGSGAMAKGWLKDGETWYHLSVNTGRMTTGWLRGDDGWYYLRPSGAMATGWIQIGWTWYQFSDSGKWIH